MIGSKQAPAARLGGFCVFKGQEIKAVKKMKDPFLCRLFSLCIELTHKYEMCLRQHSCCAESKRENRNANHSKRHRYLLKDQPLAAAK